MELAHYIHWHRVRLTWICSLISFCTIIREINWTSHTASIIPFMLKKANIKAPCWAPLWSLTCMGLSYQRLPPFLAAPPPCSINMARVVSLSSGPVVSSRQTRHRQRSIISSESLLVDSRGWGGGEGQKHLETLRPNIIVLDMYSCCTFH